MPTYQYRCTECGHDLEAVQKFSDSALTECPSCAGQLRKVFNAVGVVFKGSGFYRNDSRPKEGAGVNGSSKDSNGDHRADKAEKKTGTNGSGSDSGANGNGSAKKEPAASSASQGSSGTSGSASSTGSSSSS